MNDLIAKSSAALELSTVEGRTIQRISEIHQAAREYHDQRLPITLCDPGTKVPFSRGWPTKKWSLHGIDQEFRRRGNLNVGVRLGSAAIGGLIDFDCDSPEAEASLLELFEGDVPITPTFTSPRGKHRLFAWDSALSAAGKATIYFGALELRIGANCKAAHSLLPPSVTDGHRRKWLVPLSDCAPAELPQHVLTRIFTNCTPNTERDREIQRGTDEVSVLSVFSVPSVLSVSETVAVAVSASIPADLGFRHRQLFKFARILKAIPSLADADLQSLRPYFQQWYDRALPNIGTQSFDENWLEFVEGWERVKYPAGQEPIRMIFQQAVLCPPTGSAAKYEADSLRRLVALCRELQNRSGDEPFFLPCRVAGELLGITHVLANKWLRLLAKDGVIEVTEQGRVGRATRYRFIEE